MDDMLTEKRLQSVIELAAAIAQRGWAFRVFPPSELTQDASVVDRNDAATRLVATVRGRRRAPADVSRVNVPDPQPSRLADPRLARAGGRLTL
jgi:hypothetical protein